MTYTINGKEWIESEINKRCAELLEIKYITNDVYVLIPDPVMSMEASCSQYMEYNPCNNPSDTDAIIDKCWDELMKPINPNDITRWENLKDGCGGSKLVAACICYIEINEAAL
jgi:hypothetical protein